VKPIEEAGLSGNYWSLPKQLDGVERSISLGNLCMPFLTAHFSPLEYD